MAASLAQEIAELPEDERRAALEGVDMDHLLYDWAFWSRPEQRPPDWVEWTIWTIMAGRGVGKTRSGAEWIREKAKEPHKRIALIARTSADSRDVIIEGESGIMNICPPSEMPKYEPSKRRLVFPSGTIATAFSADTPDQLRGPQAHYTWCDELAAWNHVPGVDGATAWDNAQIMTRLGDRPQLLVTTTPKRVPAMQDLVKRDGRDVVITRGSTMDNIGNLSETYINFVFGLYEGTRMAQQELFGILLDDVEGALWDDELIGRARVDAVPLGLPLRVIAVDPSVAEEPRDECGIIVAAATGSKYISQRHAYVLEDASIHGNPDVWGKQVVAMYEKWQCPVVVEVNQGGALVKRMIHAIDPSIPVIEVRAKQGKHIRAEPVLLKYDQGKVHHVGFHPYLEAQQTSWVPGDAKSPDRVDALVYAVLALIVDPSNALGAGPLRAKSPSRHQLPVASRGRSIAGMGRGGRRMAA